MTNPALHDAMLAAQTFARWALVQLDRQDREERVREAAREMRAMLDRAGL